MLLRDVIGRPQQAHGVRSEREYRERAKAFLLRHGLPPTLTEQKERPVAYVSDGRWVIDCECGNGPSASPEWRIAVCLECGAVYQPRFPDDLAEVERELLARPSPRNRHYRPQDDETAASLRAENRRHGIGGD